MKLLLLSLGLTAIKNFITPPASVAFIATAGEVYDDPYFVRNDREQLIRLGYKIADIDISGGNKKEIIAGLESADVIYVAGGNTFYLLQQIRQKNIEEEFRALIKQGKPYIGASAGAALVGPHLDPIETLDDTAAAPLLKMRHGLCLTDFVVLPHYGKPKYLSRYEEIIAKHGLKWPLITLSDEEALLVSERDRYEKVASPII